MLAIGDFLLVKHYGNDVGADILVLPEIVCDDFTSWDAANDHFANLDRASVEARVFDSNHNGIPCEGLMARNRVANERFDIVCNDFRHRDEAEHFLASAGESDADKFGLDQDKDGQPCETLPPLDDIDRVLNRLKRLESQDNLQGIDRDCNDFETWIKANEFFIQAGGPDLDPHRLDGDSNGIPCESLPGAPRT